MSDIRPGFPGPRKGTEWARRVAEGKRSAGSRRTAAFREAMHRRLLDALGAAPGPLDRQELAVAIGYAGDFGGQLLPRLADLVAEGLAVEGEADRPRADGRGTHRARVWSMARPGR